MRRILSNVLAMIQPYGVMTAVPSPDEPIIADASSTPAPRQPLKRVAYLMSRFSQASETFVLQEILTLEQMGLHVDIFPVVYQALPVAQSEASSLGARIHASPMFSVRVLAAQWHWLRKHPAAYMRVWGQVLRGNLSSLKQFIRAVVVVPEAALFALQMQQFGIEHIHAHWATYPTLAAYVIQQLTGLPYSFTAHAYDIHDAKPMLEEKIHRASFVVTVSEYHRRMLCQMYGTAADDKMVVIYCGADPEEFKPLPDRQHREPFTIVCVANLYDYKGHRYLIDACAHLQAQGIPFRCLLIGEGEERSAIAARIAKLGLVDQVSLFGYQPHARVREIIADADVVVLPSIITSDGNKEGIPVPLVESLANEVPVIATDIAGIPELIIDGHTGLLAPERDAYTLAEALLRLYHDPEFRKQLGKAGREKVCREFNIHRNVAMLYGLMIHNWHPTTATTVQSTLVSAASEI